MVVVVYIYLLSLSDIMIIIIIIQSTPLNFTNNPHRLTSIRSRFAIYPNHHPNLCINNDIDDNDIDDNYNTTLFISID